MSPKKTKKINTTSYPLPATHYQRGFTLIEAVISAGVFALAATSIVGVYTSIQRLNTRSRAQEAIEQNIRFISEDLSKLITNGAVDYASYQGGSVLQPTTPDLYVLDHTSSRVHIYRNGNVLAYDRNGTAYQTTYTGREVKVLDFRVFITPVTNPFPIGAATPREQPTVTVYLLFEANLGSRDAIRQIFQTTIATKQYPESL